MSIIKLIRCNIKKGRERDFSRGQLAWRELSKCDGFEGQLGGWTKSDDAVVLGGWSSQEHVRHFMSSIHDNIYDKSNQSGTYSHCNVQYFEKVLDITSTGSGRAASQQSIFQLTLCREVEAIDRFMRDQKWLWNPSLGNAKGMLSGVVARSLAHRDQFLVVTRWNSNRNYQGYRESVLPSLKQQVKPEDYIKDISGFLVREENLWTVKPDHAVQLIQNPSLIFM
ncbi:YdbC family protein [Thalassotalea mangrovi]|uniref:YdbC family protein n=1 Tax=Thalassotalea mangrovi TaxID=2572245 RepID=UPI00145DE133|nr:YdbC family protein [Thalassotalea mangrovi]